MAILGVCAIMACHARRGVTMHSARAAACQCVPMHPGSLAGPCSTVRYSSTDDLIFTDSQSQDSACMHECSGFRSAAGRRCCAQVTYTSDPGTKSCTFTVSLLLSFSEAAHDGPVRNRIHNRTVVCRLRESPPRAHCTCTSLSFHCKTLAV